MILATGVSACGDSGDDSNTAADTATPDRPDDDATNVVKPRPPRHESSDRRWGGAKGAPSSGGHAKGSWSGNRAATRTALSGNPEEARAAAVAVDGAYKNLAGAIRSGVAAVDVAVAGTLEAAEGNGGLTSVCRLMSEEAKRQTIDYAKRGAGLADIDWTCEKATGLMLRRTRQHGALERTLRAEVVGVNAEGDRATATVRFGDGKRPLSTIPLVKEGGQWKLGASLGGGG